MDTEDEFGKCLKKQCLDSNKENANPNIISPFLNKLTNISFGSDDFMQNEDGKNYFHTMFKDVPSNELSDPKKPPSKVKTAKRKPKAVNKTTYQSLRTPRSGLTMCQMMDATRTPEQVVSFLQEQGCLQLNRQCPSCDNPMVLVDRCEKLQSKYFQCNRRHENGTRCRKTISVMRDFFFFSMPTCRYLHSFGFYGVFVKGCIMIGLFGIWVCLQGLLLIG